MAAVDGATRMLLFLVPIKGAANAIRTANEFFFMCKEWSIPKQVIFDQVC